MYERILQSCRQRIRTGRYVTTLHAYDKMTAQGYDGSDVEAGVLNGRVIERQRDEETNERKYRILGRTRLLRPIELIVKFGLTGSLVIITVYEP